MEIEVGKVRENEGWGRKGIDGKLGEIKRSRERRGNERKESRGNM